MSRACVNPNTQQYQVSVQTMTILMRLVVVAMIFVGVTAQTKPNKTATRSRVVNSVVTKTKPSSTASNPASKLIETIKTSDGREIKLYDNNTYEVIRLVVPSQIELSLKAGVITNGGETRIVARADFLIFDRDVEPMLKKMFEKESKLGNINLSGLHPFYIIQKFPELDNNETKFRQAMEMLKPHIVGKVTTDFDGKTAIKLPQKQDTDYYIYGYFQVGKSDAIWYVSFSPKSDISIILDNKNMR